MKSIVLFILSMFLIGSQADAQFLKKGEQKENRKDRRIKYFDYWDADSTILNTKGQYRDGMPYKTWRYYHKNGKKRMKVKYGDRLKIKYFKESGQLDKKGYAILDLDPANIHFYWQGTWKYFDERRKLYRIALFENGIETKILMGPEDPVYYE